MTMSVEERKEVNIMKIIMVFFMMVLMIMIMMARSVFRSVKMSQKSLYDDAMIIIIMVIIIIVTIIFINARRLRSQYASPCQGRNVALCPGSSARRSASS